MTNETDTLLGDGLDWLQERKGVTLNILDDLQTPISGINSALSAADVAFLFEGDIREAALFEVKRPVPKAIRNGNACDIALNDQLKDGHEKWEVVKREDNPADVRVKFYLIKKV